MEHINYFGETSEEIFYAAPGEELEESDSENEESRANAEEDNPNINDDVGQNQPLYRGSRISVGESMLLILALLLHHNLTLTCIEDIIIVLELHCLRQSLHKNSLYKFKKYFGLNGISDMIRHYYCSICNRDLRSANDICSTCKEAKKLFFVELPLVNQLQVMYSRPGFFNVLQFRSQKPHIPGVFSDVYDGHLYQTWVKNGFLNNPYNISFSWYTDGIPVFKSSQISIWPIYLTINELPFKDRKKRQNLLLLGFWYGNEKPDMNTVFHKFRPQLEQIANGIEITLPDNSVIFIKGVVLTGVCDLPAKSNCLNFTQYNGAHGCASCLCKGRSEQLGENCHTYIFPYEKNFLPRTTAQCISDAYDARPDAPVRGIKGHSTLARVMPDFINGIGIDRMHGIEGGVFKKMLILFFDGKFRGFPFSLYNFIDVINSRLKDIKQPKFIHRMPRSVTDLIHWKTSELKMFLFYCSIPVFEGLMRIDYFDHYLRLLIATSILSANEVTEFQIQVAENLLHRFVREFETLYGIQFCSMNIHQLLHSGDYVRNLGPLWAYTCYEYENINGQFLKLIHGTCRIDTQVANSHTLFIKMAKLIEDLPHGAVRTFCLLRKKQVKIIEEIYPHCYSVGAYKKLEVISDRIMNILQRCGITVNNFTTIWQYFRLLKNNKLHISSMYGREIQTQSSAAVFNSNNQSKLGLIESFLKVINCNCMQRKCSCLAEHYAIIKEISSDSIFLAEGDNVFYSSIQFLHKCHAEKNYVVMPIKNLLNVCIYMKVDNKEFIAIPINDKENE